jgi:hypothetical protein
MATLPSRLLTLAAALFLGGWVLVLASGHGGNATGGSEALWQAGGLMVYASLPLLLVAAGWLLALRLRSPSRPR